MEKKLDGFGQEAKQDCLIFSGIKERPGLNLDTTVLNFIISTMGVSTIAREHFVSIQRLKLSSTNESRHSASKSLDICF